MMHLILVLAMITPPGKADAMDAFAGGEFYLVTFGRMAAGVHRDDSTGIMLQSLGCVIGEGDMEYREEWNGHILHLWEYLGSDSTFFSLTAEDEALVYSAGEMVYRDRWGSVPVELHPEDLAALSWLARNYLAAEREDEFALTMYSPLWEETLTVQVPGAGIAGELLERGRRAIRVNDQV